MEKVKIALAAKNLGVSLNSVYRKVKQCETELNGHISKDRGITFISVEGVEILRSLFQKLNPSETCDNKDFTTVKHLEKVIADQQRTIDTLISQHAEERTRTAEERTRADTIIMKLANDLEVTRKSALAIEAKVDALGKKPEKDPIDEVLSRPTPKIKPWTPPAKVADPLEGLGFLQKIWVQFVEPQKLRRYDS